jgi:hypothetical protein
MGITNYSVTFTPGLVGGLATGSPYSVIGRLNEDSVVIPYGRAVVQGSTPDAAILPTSTAKDFIGVCYRVYAYENAQNAQGDFGYAPDLEFDILTKGDIWVEVEEAVAPGDAVFYRHQASGGNTTIGRFRKTADTATATQISQARWASSTTGAGLAVLTLNLP